MNKKIQLFKPRKEIIKSIDISKYMEKIVSKNYDLLKELGR